MTQPRGKAPFLILLAAALVAAPPAAHGAESKSSAPRIADCRVGFRGVYKVGHWTPVWVDVDGADALDEPRIEITVGDSDGVPTTVSMPVVVPTSPDAPATTLLNTKVGRLDSPLVVSLWSDGRMVDRREMLAAPTDHKEGALDDLPATGELLVAAGSQPFGLEEAFGPRDSLGSETARRTVRLDRITELPLAWYGYDAVDVLVLSMRDGALCHDLAADAVRMAALRRWVELGGRLVILCDGNAAQALFTEGQPLAAFAPGKFSGVVRLGQTGPLEQFAERTAVIADQGQRVELDVPRLTDVTGRIEAYAGQRPGDLPLVVRRPFGLGEVALAGVDLAAPPLADWPGRTAFLHALLRPYLAKPVTSESPQSLTTLGYNDLSGALRQRLGNSFVSVRTISFPAVASLAIVYLLLLGPGDYWLVHKLLRRPGAAWITFPVLVVAVSVAAYALGGWSKGAGDPRVNQLQLLDVDLTTSLARGTYWGALYSPDARRYDLALSSPPIAGDTASNIQEPVQTLLSNWGLVGAGIGGMDGRTMPVDRMRTGYHYSPALDALLGVPLLTGSTKSFLGRWTAPAPTLVEARLVDEDDLAVGSVTNRSGRSLENARLLYGTWACRLGTLADGQQIRVGPHLNAIQVKTMVARNAGIATDRFSAETARSIFYSDRATADELLNLIMFYEAAGGQAFAQLPNRYQSYCDLSRLLELGRAILVAELSGPEQQLIDNRTGEPLARPSDGSTVMCRIVLPVERSAN